MIQSSRREYNIWAMMRQRCNNPNAANYANYGGRGIVVCERWSKFSNFWEDMGAAPSKSHTLDRLDNDGPYSPENCVWSSVEAQQNNRRNTVCITAYGEKRSLAQWSRLTGLTRDQIKHRIFSMGMAPEEALEAPRMSHNQRPVEQLDFSGAVVARFESLADTERKGGFNRQGVQHVLAGRAKTSGGFRWRYAV